MTKKQKEETVSMGCQLAYEYEGWGPEHIMDMLNIENDGGVVENPCDYDQLTQVAGEANKLKKEGLSFSEAVEKLMDFDICYA